MNLKQITAKLVGELTPLTFPAPIAHVYNPLLYAHRPHALYLERYGQPTKEIVFLGMNPGPWGMAQTGVPFGEIEHVRDWLGIEAPVERPRQEHPKRPIEGFACKKSEVSGRRLWSYFKAHFGTSDAFFERCYVANYCPLVFMEASARNLTPDKLPSAIKNQLETICDTALRESVIHLKPRYVIGVGGFAESRAKIALTGLEVRIGRILHPSPASPAANRGWAETAHKELKAQGIHF